MRRKDQKMVEESLREMSHHEQSIATRDREEGLPRKEQANPPKRIIESACYTPLQMPIMSQSATKQSNVPLKVFRQLIFVAWRHDI